MPPDVFFQAEDASKPFSESPGPHWGSLRRSPKHWSAAEGVSPLNPLDLGARFCPLIMPQYKLAAPLTIKAGGIVPHPQFCWARTDTATGCTGWQAVTGTLPGRWANAGHVNAVHVATLGPGGGFGLRLLVLVGIATILYDMCAREYWLKIVNVL